MYMYMHVYMCRCDASIHIRMYNYFSTGSTFQSQVHVLDSLRYITVCVFCIPLPVQIMATALRFFLTGDEVAEERETESSDESGTEALALRDMVLSRQIIKSGRKRERKVARAKAVLKVGTQHGQLYDAVPTKFSMASR